MQVQGRFLDTLRSRLSIAEVVGEKVKLTRKGREFTGLCPFHHEKTSSFTVSEVKGFYHCFGCGAHGDVIRFLIEAHRYTFIEAVKELAKRAGLSLPNEEFFSKNHEPQEDLSSLEDVLKEAALWFHKNLFLGKSSKAYQYAERRGISRETLKKFCVGYAPEDYHALEMHFKEKGFSTETLLKVGLLTQKDEDSSPYDRFRRRLMFPIFDHKGKVVGFGGRLLDKGDPKYLNSPETPLFSKGKLLYGYNFAKDKAPADPLIIVEGYMDALSLQQAGYHGALAPLGTALTEDQILLAWRLSSDPILCFDGDAAGFKAAARAAERVLPLLKPGYSLKFALLPQGEDPDSLIQKGGNFNTILEHAYPLIDMLWLFLTQGKTFKTPEQKAALQNQYSLWCKSIQNQNIRSSYQLAFKDLFYKNIIQIKDKRTPVSNLKQKKINFLFIHERLLLAILLNHPNLIDETSDDLTFLDFKEESLHTVKEAILKFYAAAESKQTDLIDYLTNAGLQSEVQEILSPHVLIHGSFAKPTASKEEAFAGWQEIYQRLQKTLGKDDLREAQENLAEEMSPETWNRYKMLKKSALSQE